MESFESQVFGPILGHPKAQQSDRANEMTRDRRIEVEVFGSRLTEDEVLDGWHFCFEWDGMLVGPGMDEQDACTCFRKAREVKNRKRGSNE